MCCCLCITCLSARFSSGEVSAPHGRAVLVSRMCLWVSYECVGVTSVPVGELRMCLCRECACG